LDSEERKERDVWNINNTDGEGIAANILFNFLVSEGDLDPEEDNIYDLEPVDYFYRMYQFHVPQLNRNYAVDDYDETETTAKDYLKEYFEDDDNLDNITVETLKNNLDEEYLTRMIREVHEDWIYNDPESYLDSSQRELSKEQQLLIDSYSQKISNLESEIQKLARLNIDDENQQKKIDNYLLKLTSTVEDYNSQIQEIKEDPQGEWSDSAIEDAIEREVERYTDDLPQFVADHEIPYNMAVDMESLIDYVYEYDGYDIFPTYDGKAEEVNFKGDTYIILRLS